MHTTHNPSSITRNPAEKHTFSAKERDTETGLSYFGARYYSSDLSVWLSVDPMSDEYPSLSPYVYCADNPVKLMDPNGMQWETAEDISTAKDLITTAERKIKANNKLIASANKNLKKGEMEQDKYDDFVNDLKGQNKLLEEGIQGIKNMGTDRQIFHFNVDETRTHHNVTKVNKNGSQVISINVNEMKNIQWHECVHIADYLNDPIKHGFTDGTLGSINSNLAEKHAYRSEWSFYHDVERFPKINRLYDINDSFVEKRKSLDKK